MSTVLNVSPLIAIILDYLKGKDIVNKRDFSQEAAEIKGRLLVDGKPEIEVLRELQDISFYDHDYFEYDTIPGASSYDFKVALSRLKDAVMSSISFVEPAALKRQASPSLEAYDYVGNNRTDHRPSGITHGLLFE
jgi:hypothetical protein